MTAKEITRPAALLVTGRVIGLVASFAIGIVLARFFAPDLEDCHRLGQLVGLILEALRGRGTFPPTAVID